MGKESAFTVEDTGDVGSIPGSGRSPGEGNGNPLQYSCLGNPMDRGAVADIFESSPYSNNTGTIKYDSGFMPLAY